MVSFDEVHEYALGLPFVTEDMPFGDEHITMRIGGKIFMIISFDDEGLYISVKCDPDRASDLRERYPEIEPAFHMNKRHWNGIHCGGHLSRSVIEGEIRHSYELVLSKLPAKLRQQFAQHP